MKDGVYVRRVKDPNPILEELARQVCDALPDGSRRPAALAQAAVLAGVPINYVLDELERRVRARVP